jgi:RNA polymerase sigma-70 factor (ECF subfamily)
MIGHLLMAWEASVGVESEVAQLRRGDPNALSALLMRYQNRLYRYLLRIVHEQAEAEDLFQQTWVRVAEKISQFDLRRNFEPWLFALARNLAIDYLRRVRPSSLDEPVGEAESGITAGERLASNQPPVLDGILERERAGRLASALETLSVPYREVLTLRFEEEMKLEEIAEVLAIPLSTVKTRLRRALERMRQELERGYPGEDWRTLN